MVDGLGVDALDDGQLVGLGCGVGEQLAEPCPRLAVLGELVLGGRDGKPFLLGGHRGEPLAHAHCIGQVGVKNLVERGLVVEQVNLWGGARHEKIDHPLGLGREVRQAGQAGKGLGGIIRRLFGRLGLILPHQVGEGDAAHAQTAGVEKLSPGLLVQMFGEWVHVSSWSRFHPGSAAGWRSWRRRPVHPGQAGCLLPNRQRLAAAWRPRGRP